MVRARWRSRHSGSTLADRQSTIESVTASPPPRRRVLEPAQAQGEKRSGCIMLGAVLGVLVGATFAFYGLPPILRHFYGEQRVAAGQERTAEGKTFRVLAVYAGFDPICVGTNVAGSPCRDVVQVSLTVAAAAAWAPAPADFQLELRDVDDWIPAVSLPPGVVMEPPGEEFSFAFQAGANRPLVLRFPVPEGLTGAAVTPRALHLASPRLKFELPEPRR